MTQTDPQPIPDPTRAILDSITDGVFTVDIDFRITSFNRAAEWITGVPRAEALGKPCSDVFHASTCEEACALRETMTSGEEIQMRPIHIVRPDGATTPLCISTAGVETFRDLSVIEGLRQELSGRHTFQDIISKNQRMQQIFEILPNIATSGSTVLIEGPSGCGKELIARAIHALSERAPGPMVTVNCGALPDTLLESELFGLALANGGTIFLDEIGDVSPALQVRLLRVLQERSYEPVGSSRPVQADVRVVAATNKDLRQEIEAGRFRDDLYYRLNVMRLEIPALSDRRDDIPLLANHFLERFNRLQGRMIAMISDEAMATLARYPWPGNVRELENAIEHAFILCTGTAILPEHLPPEIGGSEKPERPAGSPLGRTMQQIETQAILSALDRHAWKRGDAAAELGIDKSTLWRKMKRLGIRPPASDRS